VSATPNRALSCAVLLLLACGRLGFTPTGAGDEAGGADGAAPGEVNADAAPSLPKVDAQQGVEAALDTSSGSAAMDLRAADAPGAGDIALDPSVDAALGARPVDLGSPILGEVGGPGHDAAVAPPDDVTVAPVDLSPPRLAIDVSVEAAPVSQDAAVDAIADAGLPDAAAAAPLDAESIAYEAGTDLDPTGADAMEPDASTDAPGESDAGADAPDDASVDAGPDPCPGLPDAGAIVCEGFESLTLPAPAQYETHQSNGSLVEISGTTVHGGARALHALVHPSQEKGEGTAALRKVFAPITSGLIYYRAHLRIGPGAPAKDWLVLMELDGATNTTGDQKVSIDSFGSDELAVTANGPNYYQRTSAMSLPRQRWFCLELVINVAPAGGSIEVLLDGAPLLSGTGLNTLLPGGYVAATLGLYSAKGLAKDLDTYYDDLVLARTRLSCQ
jgi:hypothetical protein